MTTPAEIEAAFATLPPGDREPLLSRLARVVWGEAADVPPLTPEQIATVERRAAEVARGDAELVPHAEVMRAADEKIAAAERAAGGRQPMSGRLADAA